MEWIATYRNPKMGEINTYLVTDGFLSFMDDFVYVDRDDNTKVIDPKRFGGIDSARVVKCLWLHDMNKGHDTLRRNFIGAAMVDNMQLLEND